MDLGNGDYEVKDEEPCDPTTDTACIPKDFEYEEFGKYHDFRKDQLLQFYMYDLTMIHTQ